MEKLAVLKRGKVLYVKVYGKEWELILPQEPKKVVKKTKKSPTLPKKKPVGEE